MGKRDDHLLVAIVSPLIDWINSPRMLQLELRRPWVYRMIVWTCELLLFAPMLLLLLWFYGML